jgi:hypothetical protein
MLGGLERRAKEKRKGYPGKFIWRKISMEIGNMYIHEEKREHSRKETQENRR